MMRRKATNLTIIVRVVAVAVGGCASEPSRPMPPELDPASTRGPVPSWSAAPSPLSDEVPMSADAKGADDAVPHGDAHHGHHGAAQGHQGHEHHQAAPPISSVDAGAADNGAGEGQ